MHYQKCCNRMNEHTHTHTHTYIYIYIIYIYIYIIYIYIYIYIYMNVMSKFGVYIIKEKLIPIEIFNN